MKKTLLLLLALSLFSCSGDESYTKYSRYKAAFSYLYVSTTTPLRAALNGPNEFCTIKLSVGKLLFNSLNNSQQVDVTASAHYERYVCISGFIVGMSNMIELGKDDIDRVCYDLVCPNCYKDFSIKRDLQLREHGLAYCSRCKRAYALNNFGQVDSGDPGRPLERYHVAYDGANVMTIYN